MTDPYAGFDLPAAMVDLEAIVEYPNLLVFSKPKAGKTIWACSDDQILLINAEAGGDSSAARSEIKGDWIKQWPVPEWEDFEACLEWCQECVRKHGYLPFKWIVLDTITTLQDRQLMRFIMEKMHKKRPDRNLWIPDKPEYFENQQILVQKIKELCDLPCPIVLTAHVMEKVDAENNQFYYPQIQGGGFRVAQQVLSYMTSYGYLYSKVRKKDGKPIIQADGKPLRDRYIMWDDHDKMQGGDRLDFLAPYTANKTLKWVRETNEMKNKEIQEKKNGINQA